MAIRRAAGRFREVSWIPVLAAALFLMAGATFGQDRSEAHDTGDRELQAVPSEPSPPPEPEPPAPSEPPAGSSDSSESRTAVPSDSSPPAPEPPAPSEPAASSSDSSEPRTAVPIGPGDHEGRPHRQPPNRHDHGGGDHGGEVDGGYTETAGSGWSSYEDGAGRQPYSSGHAPWRRYGHGPRDDMGALDLDINPGRTQVYLDGQKIGTADDFDGWPRYLLLPKGTYEIVFYLDGYKTLVRQVTVYPGLVINMDDRMETGASTRPEDLLPRPQERWD
jgi:hypothetical protein